MTCRKVAALYAAGNRFLRVPRAIFAWSHLKTLVLSGNLLTCLPNDMRSFFFLQTLDLSNNHLRGYPSFLSGINALKQLSLSHNAISNLGQGFPKNLQLFDLSYNLLQDISFELTHLVGVSLDYNQLKHIRPSMFSGCHFLSLNGNPLQGNSLQKLPEFIQLTRIKVLECIGNEPVQLPPLPIRILDSSNLSFSTRFGIGYAATVGRRATMEDSVVFKNFDDTIFLTGVFDSHCGKHIRPLPRARGPAPCRRRAPRRHPRGIRGKLYRRQ
jgi:hypothetical protein